MEDGHAGGVVREVELQDAIEDQQDHRTMVPVARAVVHAEQEEIV